MFLDCSRNTHPQTHTHSLILLRSPNPVPGSTSCWRTSHPSSNLFWHRDPRSSRPQRTTHQALSLRRAGPLSSNPVAEGPTCLLGSWPSVWWSSFTDRAFISVLFCLPPSLPVFLSAFISLSFPITPFMHSSIHSRFCLCNPFSSPLALSNLSSVFCPHSSGFL